MQHVVHINKYCTVLPMIVNMMIHSKTIHLASQTAALLKGFVPESRNRLEGNSALSWSVITARLRGIFQATLTNDQLFNFSFKLLSLPMGLVTIDDMVEPSPETSPESRLPWPVASLHLTLAWTKVSQCSDNSVKIIKSLWKTCILWSFYLRLSYVKSRWVLLSQIEFSLTET